MNKNLKNEFPRVDFLNFKNIEPHIPELRDIHVWKINISLLKQNLNFFEKIISSDEYEKTLKFKFYDDRLRACISRGCLRILCGEYLLKAPENLKFEYTSKGKPCLLSADFSFNVTHSKDLVLIGFSKFGSFGIDVEYNRLMDDYMSIGEKYFHPEESAFLRSLSEDKRKALFLRYWTAKEAYVKALGDGIGKALDSFYVKGSFSLDQFERIHETEKNIRRRSYVYSFLPQDNYFASFCFIQ